MKKVIFALMLSTLGLIGTPAWAAPQAAQYTVDVHVTASHTIHECDSVLGSVACGKKLHINVIIDGKKFVLDGGIDDYLLRLGDYKAKVVQDQAQGAAEYKRQYEFLFADGTKRKFAVISEEE
jgi:hypothetical protein